MATTKSNGLLGLPHYRASRVSTAMYEPLYLNTFIVQLTPPASLGASDTDEEVLVVLEGLQKVSGLATNKVPAVVDSQIYKGANRSFAGARPDKTTIDIATTWQLNLRYDTGSPESYTYSFLRKWCDLVYDPLTGRMDLKVNYVAPRMVITLNDRAGTPYQQWVCYNIFPTTPIKAIDLDYSSGTNIFSTEMTFRCDYWDEAWL